MDDVVVIGLGQMGGVFARAAEGAGCRVVPVTRGQDIAEVARETPAPRSVVVAVGELDLTAALDALPAGYRERTLLLQNELLPSSWTERGVVDPTVAVVWFEKKATTDLRPIRSTPIAGPQREFWVAALAGLGVPTHAVPDEQLLFELVAKNLYILTANIAGLEVGGSVGQLLAAHRPLAEVVAREVIAVQAALTGQELDFDALFAHFEASVAGDPEHGCRGRTSASRLDRLQHHARALGVPTPRMDAIASVY
ncbi:MAG: hypothetical protein IPG17_26835 [Sandaracinaceae bacterium]|jgi:ketopantoate reductase|nr:hypothetical protein [Sandaracinaceae bacterium]MBP7684718.1 hypothetical protein [Deltaproteobacteria bacterium]MBK6808132.1 hypothetical protein [Sandaracinaceae bacterium]MBK7151038.1 hypothetical protein [Sandaracinaceae bacterium]MBK7773157.1 hypothetical protein [Sandaracinaceae bacterium]